MLRLGTGDMWAVGALPQAAVGRNPGAAEVFMVMGESLMRFVGVVILGAAEKLRLGRDIPLSRGAPVAGIGLKASICGNIFALTFCNGTKSKSI